MGINFTYIATDENDEPYAGFMNENDLDYFVEQVEASEGFVPRTFVLKNGKYVEMED